MDQKETQSNQSPPRSWSLEQRDIYFCYLAPALEFVCWIVVLLVPILRLVNGPAVTEDQFAIQVALSVLALIGALILRFYNWRANKLEIGKGDGGLHNH